MPTTNNGKECLTLEEFETHIRQFIRESAKEISPLLKAHKFKKDNYDFSI